MFINFWYVAGLSADLTDQPRKRRMLGQDFVLWRDTRGVAQCVANTCSHRGGSLGDGKVKGDCIQCPYHGWQFDGAGRCVKIPSLGTSARIPSRTRIDAYPTQEKYGLVFAFLGDLPEAERCPILDVPEYRNATPDAGWAATIQHFDWNFDFQRSIENGIDGAHNEFVHPTHGFSGERPDYQLRPEEWRWLEDDWSTGFFSKSMAPPLAEARMREASGRTGNAIIEAGTGHHGAAMLWTYIYPTPAIKIHQYLFETPIDECHTSLYLLNLRNFLLEPENDARVMGRNEYVAVQDRDVLHDVRPVLTPDTNTREFFTPADVSIAKYREKLKRWEARGWRIDVDAVARTRKRTAYAIPGPGRREHRGYILDPVPLRPGSPRDAAAPDAVALEAGNGQAGV
jgi:phenylpropionate dioxygenase-like ring-hydroxylating dioxygenase large terminal subunit